MSTKPKQPYRHPVLAVLGKIVVWSIVLFVVGAVWMLLSGPDSWVTNIQGAMMIPLAVCFVAGCVAFPFLLGWGAYKGVYGALEAADTPIPSLQEIEAQLRAEGKDPSIADCVAVDQYLRSHRNEKIAVGAAWVALGFIL